MGSLWGYWRYYCREEVFGIFWLSGLVGDRDVVWILGELFFWFGDHVNVVLNVIIGDCVGIVYIYFFLFWL